MPNVSLKEKACSSRVIAKASEDVAGGKVLVATSDKNLHFGIKARARSGGDKGWASGFPTNLHTGEEG